MTVVVVVLVAWPVLGGLAAVLLARTLQVRDRHDGRRRSRAGFPAAVPSAAGPLLPVPWSPSSPSASSAEWLFG